MRTLAPNELQPGMIVLEPVKTPSGQILEIPGAEVTRQLINRMKLYRVESAVVEIPPQLALKLPAELVNAPKPQPVSAPEPQPAVSAPKTYLEESKTVKQKVAASSQFHSFQMDYALASEKLKSVFSDIIAGKETIDPNSLLESVAILFRSRNTIIELFDMLNNMRSINDTIYAHCLNVALISRMIGRWLHIAPDELNTLTLAGLFHDIGKVFIPEEILNKTEALTDEEFAEIKKHPRLGYDALKNLDIDPRIKNTALMHHERCDGSGYPSHITEEYMEPFAMITAISDVYDAMTAARAYRAPLCAFQVIANFEKDGFQKYHTQYILTFLKQIAATYQSNRVILSDGRGCKIVMLNQNDLSRPIVQFDDNSCLDLSTSRELYIKAVV